MQNLKETHTARYWLNYKKENKMATYTKLTNDEKAAIVDAEVRNLEYQMYALEVQLIAENAKTEPDAERSSALTALIAEKQTQIAAL